MLKLLQAARRLLSAAQRTVRTKEGRGDVPREKSAEAQDGKTPVPADLSQAERWLKDTFHEASDVVIDQLKTVQGHALLLYIDGLIDRDLLDRDVITPLKTTRHAVDYSFLRTHYRRRSTMEDCAREAVGGNVVLFLPGEGEAVAMELRFFDKRSVEAPDAEVTIRGPKEGFTESLRTNTSLIRRKIRNPDLMFEDLALGRQTNTQISLVYMKGIVNREVLQELKDRLAKIDIDAVLESGYIEQFIERQNWSPVSGVGMTQKPDILAYRILEGRVGILCDGTPHVLTVPELFMENLYVSEDYYSRPLHASMLRLLRLIGLFIGVLLPGLSVAIITYNQEMIPAPFLIHLITSTQRTPLPSALEAFFLILMFELLRESGTRLPRNVGSAITIVGSLIIGESAVSAGIVGAPMVIIIALTAVSSFIVPNLTEFVLVYRLFLLFLGASMGLIGIGAGLVIMLTQLISTESFGIPILSSFSREELKDNILRMPLSWMKFRPASIAKDNKRRMK